MNKNTLPTRVKKNTTNNIENTSLILSKKTSSICKVEYIILIRLY